MVGHKGVFGSYDVIECLKYTVFGNNFPFQFYAYYSSEIVVGLMWRRGLNFEYISRIHY